MTAQLAVLDQEPDVQSANLEQELLEFEDVALLRRFTLLASALAGRTVGISAMPIGERRAWTDGRTIYVTSPPSPERTSIEVLIQAWLIGHGSLAPAAISQLMRRAGAARRYLLLEGRRASTHLSVLLPGLSGFGLLSGGQPPLTVSSEESLAMALARRPELPEPPREFGLVRPRRILLGKATGELRLLPELHLRALTDVSDRAATEPDADELEPQRSLFERPQGKDNFLSRMLRSLMGTGSSPAIDAAPAGGDPVTDSPQGGRRAVASLVISLATDRLSIAKKGAEVGQTTYPEWHVSRRAYRPRWCTVYEVDPIGSAPLPRPARDTELQRRLAPLGRGLKCERRRPQGDDVDIDAAIDFRVDLATGGTPDGRVYVESLRRRRDLGVIVLLDISGSAAESGHADKTIHEHQVDSAAALLDSFNSLGDRVAAYGFHSHGRESVYMVRVKTFRQPWNGDVLARLGALEPSAYTRFGAAIRHASHILRTESGTGRQLLIVISDGFAYDTGYEGRYAEEDARRALEEARAAGIGCLCVSVGGAEDHPGLQRVFGATAYAKVEHLVDLRAQVTTLCQAALRLAHTRRQDQILTAHQHQSGHLE